MLLHNLNEDGEGYDGNVRNCGMMRVLERGRLIPYCLCRYSRVLLEGAVIEVMVNLMRKESVILWSYVIHPMYIVL